MKGMGTMQENKDSFLGTYFDKDRVILLSRVIVILSWIIAAIYAVDVVTGLTVFTLQYFRGFLGPMGFTDLVQNLLYILERPVHGILYFALLQAVSKGLLIFLDVEDNTRRAARKG